MLAAVNEAGTSKSYWQKTNYKDSINACQSEMNASCINNIKPLDP